MISVNEQKSLRNEINGVYEGAKDPNLEALLKELNNE